MCSRWLIACVLGVALTACAPVGTAGLEPTPPPSGPAALATPAASSFRIRFDPPEPGGAAFAVVVEGLDPGESIVIAATFVTGSSSSMPFTADGHGQVRVGSTGGFAPVSVTARRSNGQTASASRGDAVAPSSAPSVPAFGVRFDPDPPAPGSPFAIVVVGLRPGEAVEVGSTSTSGPSRPASFTADSRGEVRIRVTAGSPPFVVTVRRASGEAAAARFGELASASATPAAADASPGVAPPPPAAAAPSVAAAVPASPDPAPGASCPNATGAYAICGRVTSAATGSAVAGAEVKALQIHASTIATTDAAGRYTIDLAAPFDHFQVLAQPPRSSGLGPLFYGGTPCQWDATDVPVRAQVANVDIVLPRGWSISGTVRDSSGVSMGVQGAVMRYVAADDFWCPVSDLAAARTIGADGGWSTVVAEGTYRVQYDPQRYGATATYPRTWYPAAPTAASAKDVLLDRDRSGIDIAVPKGYAISGRVGRSLFDRVVPSVQIVNLDGGRITVVNEGYPLPQDATSYAYTLVVAPGTYRIRAAVRAADGSVTAYYARGAVSGFEAAAAVTVGNANVGGIDIIR